MRGRRATVPVLLVLVASACSTTPGTGGSSSDAGTGGSGAGAGPSAGAVPTATGVARRSADGPLHVDGGAGRMCIWNRSPVFVYADDLLESATSAEVEALELLGDDPGLDLVSAWVMPSVGVPKTGTWAQWPLPERDTRGKTRLRWEDRQRAVGARLEAGQPYNLVIRLRREQRPGPEGFDAVRISYRTPDAAYVLDTRTAVTFRRSEEACA